MAGVPGFHGVASYGEEPVQTPVGAPSPAPASPGDRKTQEVKFSEMPTRETKFTFHISGTVDDFKENGCKFKISSADKTGQSFLHVDKDGSLVGDPRKNILTHVEISSYSKKSAFPLSITLNSEKGPIGGSVWAGKKEPVNATMIMSESEKPLVLFSRPEDSKFDARDVHHSSITEKDLSYNIVEGAVAEIPLDSPVKGRLLNEVNQAGYLNFLKESRMPLPIHPLVNPNTGARHINVDAGYAQTISNMYWQELNTANKVAERLLCNTSSLELEFTPTASSWEQIESLPILATEPESLRPYSGSRTVSIAFQGKAIFISPQTEEYKTAIRAKFPGSSTLTHQSTPLEVVTYHPGQQQ